MKAHRAQDGTLVIRNVHVLTGHGSTMDGVDVLVRDGRVREVRRTRFDHLGARVIDGTGKTLVPGLIDAHVHLDFLDVRNGLHSWVQSRFALPRALGDLVRHGVTSIRCMADPLVPVNRLRKRAQKERFPSPAIFTAGPALTAPGGHPSSTLAKGNPWLRARIALTVDDQEAARTAVRKLHTAGVDLIKFVYQGGDYGPDRVRLRKLDHSIACAITEEAHRVGLPVSAHTHYQDDVDALLTMGVDSIEHGVIEHEMRGTETLRTWSRVGARMVPTLSIAAVFSGPTGEFYIDTARRNLTYAYEAGVRIIAGTDSMIGAMPANTLHDELRHMVHAGMSESDAIRAATADAADLLGLPDRGVIEPGRRADMVLLGSDPLERIENIADIDLVVQNGTVVYDDPDPPTPPTLGSYNASGPPVLEYVDLTEATVQDHATVQYDRSRFSDHGARTLSYFDRRTKALLRIETVVSDSNLVTRSWRCEIRAEQTDLSAVSDGRSISLSGMLAGSPVARSYPLRGRTWMQLLLFDAATFIISGEQHLDLIAIGASGRGALQLTDFKLSRKTSTSRAETVVETELVMPMWRRFWGASALFDANSGDLLREQIRGKSDRTLEWRA